ncbi:MAG: DNA polymerase III subunit delta' [Candidatus Nanopelagicales bacterium]
MSVFDSLVGQEKVVEELRAAVAGQGMTHAWLFTGPPGSGRSTAGRAFAAALQCERGGCGACTACRTTLGGTHPDVTVVDPPGAHHLVDNIRSVVAHSALAPSQGRWQVVIVEDADRLEGTDLQWRPANALLKSLEEPTPRTVWMLCAPTLSDVLPTIRSRCHHVMLRTPPIDAVAELLRRQGVDPAMAAFAARVSQGHIGRARRLATDEATRIRRAEVLRLPNQVGDLASALTSAANLVEAADDEARAATSSDFDRERGEWEQAMGAGTVGRVPRGGAAVLKDLEKAQHRRLRRTTNDVLDLALQDVLSFYRDVLTLQLRTEAPIVNVDLERDIAQIADRSTAASTLRRIDAVLAARTAIGNSAAPLLAVEAMAVALRTG